MAGGLEAVSLLRDILEKLGAVAPIDPDVERVRIEAMHVNEMARDEIHESRNRRTALQLRFEHIKRHR